METEKGDRGMTETYKEIQRLLHWWHTCPVAHAFEDEFDRRLNELLNQYAEEEYNDTKFNQL